MTEIQLKTEDLKKFFIASESVSLEAEAMNPILSKYILLDIRDGDCTIIKANLNHFCIFECQSDGLDNIRIPVDFALLSEVTKKTKSTTIKLEITEKHVQIKDGYYNSKSNIFGVLADLHNFPEMPEMPDMQRINLDVINGIKLSRGCLGTDDLKPFLKAVHLNNGLMFATNGMLGYVREYKDSDLSFSFTKEECGMICQYSYIDYGLSGDRNFNIFKYETTIYGFRKQDGVIPFNHNVLVSGITKSKSCLILSEDFINFCESTIGINQSREYCTSNFKTDGFSGMTLLRFVDTIVDNEHKIYSKTEGGVDIDFYFEPKRVLPVLKLLGTQVLRVSDESGNKITICSKDEEVFQYFIVTRINP